MKLAMLCRYFPNDAIGGGELYACELWKRAIKDFDVSLISGWKKDKALLPQETFAIDLRSSSSVKNYFRFYFGVRKYLRQIKPDVIHSMCYEFPSLGIPTAITVCHLGHLFGRTGESLKLKKWLTANRFKRADRIIAISKSTWNDLVSMGVDENKMSLAYPGINFEKFIPKKTSNQKFTVIYPSRISREKAQHIAILALKKLPAKVQRGIKLQIVGFVNDENYLFELKDMAKGLPVEIITNAAKIEDYVRNSDLVIFPTMMWEGFGIVAGEALAASKPLIASNYPAVMEVMGKHGIGIKPGDADALAEIIERLYSSSAERKKLTANAREWIISNFTWDNTYKVHKKLFENLGER